jgi:transcriptional regulator with XRE-family HTH domain
MNVDVGDGDSISPAHWERSEMRHALARRDLRAVYELLAQVGVSQRRIARLTGQSPSEVYAILARGRQVQAHEVLVRIAEGLGVPRGYMGLAYDHDTTALLDPSTSPSPKVTDRHDEVRALLSHAASATIGVDAPDATAFWQPLDKHVAPAPSRIGTSDVAHVEALTDAMRLVDDKHGGGACRDAIAAQVRWTQQLLNADMSDDVRTRLLVALADLHLVAGWTSFDLGMHPVARSYFSRALDLSRAGNDWSLTATVLYTMARLHLHVSMPSEGLRFLQLGQIAAQNSGNGLMVSLICVNEAWAHAMMDDRAQMERSLVRAANELGAADRSQPARSPRFYGEGELYAMTGTAQSTLPSADTGLLEAARSNLERSFTERGNDHPRSSALALPLLAVTDLRLGDTASAVALGERALEAARQINSVRIVDRLTLLATALDATDDADARDLLAQIRSLQGVA